MADTDIEIDLETGEEVKLVEGDTDHDDDEQDPSGSSEATTNDDGDDHQQELDHDDDNSDPEREAIRARRREERKNRKQQQREREDSFRRELSARDAIISEMRTKLDAIERRNSGAEVAQIATAKKQAEQAYSFFKDQIKVASETGNHAAVADATENMMKSQRRIDEITHIERAITQRQAQPQALDPRLLNNAAEWMKRNTWYDASRPDQDSMITMTLDQQLAREGWDPTTKEYWAELDARIKKYLPHRANRAKVASVRPKSVIAGSGQGTSGGTSNAGSYKLSAERVQALREAGLWDDPKQRTEAIKRFRDYDKQHANKG